jgi:phosphoribosylformylglycinamidine synthase
MKPKALILHATGTNRDAEAERAFELAGAQAEIVHLNQLRRGERQWRDYQILVLPGGFSYADALGAGTLLALDLQAYFTEHVTDFVNRGKPVIGICNGFQALVKGGILPGGILPGGILPGGILPGMAQAIAATEKANGERLATLTFNASGHFECRWVNLQPNSQRCLWTRDLFATIYCPVSHGEGRFITASSEIAQALAQADQAALLYAHANGAPVGGEYPANPNGSMLDIAGVCNPQGNVLGLMPHPEDHIYPYQHPRWLRGEQAGSGLALFANGVRYA